MSHLKFRIGEETPTLLYARRYLEEYGWEYSNHAQYLLLPIPTKNDYTHLIYKDTTVIGGNIHYATPHIDLLQDPFYLSENAKITAYCAIRYAQEHLPIILSDCRILIIGWGRIGKCLGQLLNQIGAKVTIYARKLEDRATLASLGYSTIDTLENVGRYRVIYNTAPTPLLSAKNTDAQQIKIDLASIKGLDGDDVIWARGLPGTDAPESSGKLIAQTLERLRKEGSL